MKLKRRNFYLEFVIGIVVVYLLVLILLFIFQRNLMYLPLENNYSGDKLEVEVEKVNIETSDNLNLLGWFHKKDLKKFNGTSINKVEAVGNYAIRVHFSDGHNTGIFSWEYLFSLGEKLKSQ